MSRKRTTYTADFKAKVVSELLEGEKTLNEIAGKYELLPKNLQNWKKQFLENASLAFDKSAVVKEYKGQIEILKKDKHIQGINNFKKGFGGTLYSEYNLTSYPLYFLRKIL